MAHANDGGAALDVMDYDARWDKYRIRLGRADLAKHRDLLTELCSRLYAELVNHADEFLVEDPASSTDPAINRQAWEANGGRCLGGDLGRSALRFTWPVSPAV